MYNIATLNQASETYDLLFIILLLLFGESMQVTYHRHMSHIIHIGHIHLCSGARGGGGGWWWLPRQFCQFQSQVK